MIRAEVSLRYFEEDCAKKIKLYSRGVYESISNHLSLLKLDSLEGKTVEDMWLIIKSNILQSVDKWIPEVTVTNKTRPKHIRELVKAKRRAWRAYNQDQSTWEYFREIRNRLTRENRKYHRDVE
ncbi:unnamed protein product, partial [Allacma fusca]